jgi:hypothetical protein
MVVIWVTIFPRKLSVIILFYPFLGHLVVFYTYSIAAVRGGGAI